jgi:predicted MFS family arabinose efflux permease
VGSRDCYQGACPGVFLHQPDPAPPAAAIIADPGIDAARTRRTERGVIAVVGAVQFVNILDFMMVMPLGPDFARDLQVPTSTLGLIGGSYTAAAAVAGLVGLLFLDRFGRRAALVVAMAGLSIGTVMGAFATDLHTLMAARILAGLFGGPATSVALAIVTDVVPAERRGRAMGAVMGAFSAASVLGLPLGLELARLSSWRTPFFVVAGLGIVVTLLARVLLPRLDGHLQAGRPPAFTASRLRAMLVRVEVQQAWLLVATTNFSSFLFVPNLSALLQQNLGYPRAALGTLYLVGGGISFFTMRLAGRVVDRFGSARLVAVSILTVGSVIACAGILQTTAVPVVLMFTLFMVFQSGRNVSQTTLTSKVPRADERAGYQSLQSAVQHGAAAAGAVSSSALLTDTGAHLEGMATLSAVSIAVGLLGIPLAFALEARLRRCPM